MWFMNNAKDIAERALLDGVRALINATDTHGSRVVLLRMVGRIPRGGRERFTILFALAERDIENLITDTFRARSREAVT